jgi:ankyrin repeat protein
MVKFLISRGLTLDDIRDDDNKALRYAASLGDIEMVNFLMDQGLNINDLRSNNNYAVKKAAYFGHIEMVKLLISYGLTIRDVRNDYSLIYYIYLFNANEVDMEDIKHQCISGLERSADGNLEMFKLFYEIYTRYNFTGFQFQNIEYKDVIRYLVSKGHKTDKLGFENVYLM